MMGPDRGEGDGSSPAPKPTQPGRPDPDRVADLLVVAAAALVLGIGLLSRPPEPAADAPSRPDPALVHELELRAIAHAASEALPEAVRDQIGLTGEALATRRGVLDDLQKRIATLPSSDELTLVWLALAAAWGEDALARDTITALAARPETLERFRFELDELTRLTGNLPAADFARLSQRLTDLGGSRWLVGLLRARALANDGDAAAHEALTGEMAGVAHAVATRHAIFFALTLGLILLGCILFLAFPAWIRPRLLRRGLARELTDSPFRLDRTRRVVLGWFAGAHLSAYLVGFVLLSFSASHFLLQPVAGLASGVIALALIGIWGRKDGDDSPLKSVFSLGAPSPGRLPRNLGWLTASVLPSLALCAAFTWFFEVLNQTLIGAPPETQSSIKQLLVSGDTLALVALAVSAVLIAPVVEEIVFRGYLYRNLRDGVGKGLAVALSGAVFSLVHMHPTLFLPLAGLGMALALLYEWTGSLWVPILAHMAFNLLTLVRIEAIWRI